MKIAPIASGSNGHSTYIETSSAKILVDMGISYKELAKRMEEINRYPEDIDACFVSHEHSDHIRGVGILSRKLDVPVYINEETLLASLPITGKISKVSILNGSAEIGNTFITTFRKPHDAVNPISFVIEDHNKKFGVITDTGYACNDTINNIKDMTSVLLESNYDPYMLDKCRYPRFLKNRIAGKRGHLSNEDAGVLVLEKARKLKSVFLGHLSANSNTPELAYETFKSIISHRKDMKKLKINMTSRYGCTGIYSI